MSPNLRLIEPLGYLDFLKLIAEANLVLTDSGGIQEETTVLNVPCLTLRNNTERPITITHGTNRLAGTRAESILAAYDELKHGPQVRSDPPPLWDGCAAQRIVARLMGNVVIQEASAASRSASPDPLRKSVHTESCT